VPQIKTKGRKDMSTIKEEAKSAKNPQSIGRIAPVNMQSETRRLDCESVTKAQAEAATGDCPSFWACCAVRG
jgi:hypothetical protein